MSNHTMNEEAASAIKALTESIRRMTRIPVVLVVDDSPEDRILISESVKEFFTKCEVIDCGDGAEALKLLRANHVDVIFLDVRLPEISGIEVLRKIKGEQDLITVIVTGLGVDTPETVEAIRLGAVRVIAKPVTQDDLRATFGTL